MGGRRFSPFAAARDANMRHTNSDTRVKIVEFIGGSLAW
jgi:hypothetical protein